MQQLHLHSRLLSVTENINNTTQKQHFESGKPILTSLFDFFLNQTWGNHIFMIFECYTYSDLISYLISTLKSFMYVTVTLRNFSQRFWNPTDAHVSPTELWFLFAWGSFWLKMEIYLRRLQNTRETRSCKLLVLISVCTGNMNLLLHPPVIFLESRLVSVMSFYIRPSTRD